MGEGVVSRSFFCFFDLVLGFKEKLIFICEFGEFFLFDFICCLKDRCMNVGGGVVVRGLDC